MRGRVRRTCRDHLRDGQQLAGICARDSAESVGNLASISISYTGQFAAASVGKTQQYGARTVIADLLKGVEGNGRCATSDQDSGRPDW